MAKRGVVWQLWKLCIGAATGIGFTFIYYPVSAYTAGRSTDLMTAFDLAIPFVPWTWWIYFPGYLAGLLWAIFTIRDNRIILSTCSAMLLCQLMSVFVYLTLPSTFPRPLDAGPGLTGDAIRWFWTIDPPNNTFPSTHCAMCVLCVLGLWRERNPHLWFSVLAAVGVIITVHTTKQHYWIDAVAGAIFAYVAYYIVFDLLPVWRGKRPIYPLPDRLDPDAPLPELRPQLATNPPT